MLNTSNIKHPQHQIIRAIVHCSMLFALNGTPITINWLVVLTILKNMKVNGKDYPKYIMENKIHVWNHQPVNITKILLLLQLLLILIILDILVSLPLFNINIYDSWNYWGKLIQLPCQALPSRGSRPWQLPVGHQKQQQPRRRRTEENQQYYMQNLGRFLQSLGYLLVAIPRSYT